MIISNKIDFFKGKLYTSLLLLLIVISIGVIGYMFISGDTFVDSLYMTIITMTTVGFGELHAFNEYEKLFTIFLILISIVVYGYSVTAITGKETERDFLIQLGAAEVLLRSEIENFDKKPLLKPLFAGAIDTVGGIILENIIKSTNSMGVITSCGNVASPKLDLTVFPFTFKSDSFAINKFT